MHHFDTPEKISIKYLAGKNAHPSQVYHYFPLDSRDEKLQKTNINPLIFLPGVSIMQSNKMHHLI